MCKHLFTERERHILNQNPNDKRLSEKAITYSESFKLLFIEHFEKGKAAHQIFKKAGFDVDILTMERVKNCAKRWSRAVIQLDSLG